MIGAEVPVAPHAGALLVLYASQTGNAQDVAERIGREAQRRHYSVRVLPADGYLPAVAALPSEPALVFVASTTGQGEAPSNMRQLWRFLLRKSLPAGSLGALQAAVFGLGDSGYPKYNVAAKKLYRRLEALGATMLLPLGLGDDQHRSGYEAALDPWLAQLWPVLRRRFPLPPGLTEPGPGDVATRLVCKYSVTWLPPDEAAAAAAAAAAEAGEERARDGAAATPASAAHWEALDAARAFGAVEAAASGAPAPADSAATPGGGAAAAYGPGRPYWARLQGNRRITAAEHFQDVRLLEFDLGGSGIAYQPGDVLAVAPRQPAAAVAALAARCGWDPAAWVRVGSAAPAPAAAEGVVASTVSATVRVGALLAGALDVAGASPRRFFFQARSPPVLRQFAGTELEQERLAHLSSPEGRDELYEYNQREGRTVLEVLGDFKSVQLPLEWLLQAAPRLRPRLFSIASSLALHPARAQLAVAIVEWVTPFRRRRRGVCTSWLAGLDPAQGEVRVPVWAERGALRLPPDPATPLLMVGPGTGVAPFRAFLQERAAAAAAGVPPLPAPSMLVFGCRNEAGDFYFRDEWQEMQAAGVLAPPPLGLLTAFSRDGPSKVYVQQRIREQGREVWRLLCQRGAWVYVAGSADKMPAQVATALEAAVAEHGGVAAEEAAALLRRMELTGRYQVEAWS